MTTQLLALDSDTRHFEIAVVIFVLAFFVGLFGVSQSSDGGSLLFFLVIAVGLVIVGVLVL